VINICCWLTEENMKLEALSESYSIEDYGGSD